MRPRPRTLEEEMASIKYSDSKMSAFAMIKYTDKEFESIRAMCKEPKLQDICAKKK